jgi:ribosome-associated protein
VATTKRATGGRPTIGSSHSGRARPGAGAAKGAPAKPGTRSPRPATGAKPGARPGARPRPGAAARPPLKPTKKRVPPAKKGDGARRPAAAAPASTRRATPEIRSAPSEEAKQASLIVATAALDKKVVNVQILDVVGRIDYADYLVLMSGRSDRHVLSIADSIEEGMRKIGRKPNAVEGRQGGNWVVLDFGDIVAHVFQEEARSFYDLDSLWQDARRIPVSGTGGPSTLV